MRHTSPKTTTLMRMITANCPLGPKIDQFQANVPTAGRIVDLLVTGINIVLLLS